MIKKILLLMMVLLMPMGCDMPVGTNNDWQNVVKAAGSECPDITGTYSIMDQPGQIMLGGHYEETPKDWSTMTISGNPQQELFITLYEATTGVASTKPITRARGKDYQCDAGWLKTAWPYFAIPINKLDESISEDELVEKSLSFAKNNMGELVIRTNTHTWQGIAVWCGDGCKYLPIPFTGHTRHQWSRWPSSAIPVVSAPVNKPVTDANIIAEDYQETFDDEALNDETPEGKATRVLKKITPRGVKLIRVVNNGNVWKATFRGATNAMIALHEAMQTSAEIQVLDIQIDRSSSIKEAIVELRFAPTSAERDAKKADEAARLAVAKQHEEMDRALVKRLLPSFPKGMVMTASHHDASGFLVEVRHNDETAFAQLITNALGSGEFLTAAIKTHKTPDPYGRRVVDILFTPKPNEVNP